MFDMIGKLFEALTRLVNVINILAKEGEAMAGDFAKEQKLRRKNRLEAIARGEDPDADPDDE